MNPASSTAAKRLMLLFTTTGYNAADFARAAQNLDVQVVFGTDRCHLLEDPWHDSAVPLRFDAPAKAVEAILQYARTRPLDGLVAIGDKPTVTAAFAGRALGLPSNSPQAVESCRNKFQSRRVLKKAGLPTPPFTCYEISQDPRFIVPNVRYPCVLKPLILSASQGVIRADNRDEFELAFERICALLRSPSIRIGRDRSNEHILVEDFIQGRELALEGILRHGELQVLALFDKPDSLDGPFFEETLYVTPSRLPEQTQGEIAACTQSATRALGLSEGPIHAELRVNDSGPWILEVAPRSIGGLCSRALRFRLGMTLEEIIIRHALGLEDGLPQEEHGATGVMMIPIPRGGYLYAVEGIQRAQQVGGILDVAITAKMGQKLIPLPEGSSYLGFIFARGSSPESVEQSLRTAHQNLQFKIMPELPVI
jgi:biotin carboxylase